VVENAKFSSTINLLIFLKFKHFYLYLIVRTVFLLSVMRAIFAQVTAKYICGCPKNILAREFVSKNDKKKTQILSRSKRSIDRCPADPL
jgi:hypothetical protein